MSRILYVGITGFCLGIFYAEFLTINSLLFVAMVILAYFIRYRSYRNLIIIFLLFFLLGFIRLSVSINTVDVLQNYLSKNISLKGVVVGEVTESRYYRNFELQPIDVEAQNVLIRTSYRDEIKVGDVMVVSGVLEKPQSFINESGIEFNYPGFLRAKGVGYIMSKAWIEKTGESHFSVKSKLYDIKSSFIENIKSIFNFPESALLAGLLVGSKESLGDIYLEQFRAAGLTHIIVLSGFNIAIVAAIVLFLTSFLPRTISLSLAILGVFLFSLMVGFESTVLRATIMVLIALGGKFINRTYDALRALMIAGSLMLLVNPHLLLHDVSFELSFLASLSLILVVPVIERFFTWVPEVVGFREIVVSTVAVEILVMPLILYRIGEVSMVSLFSNIAVLPIIGPTMLFGFLSGLSFYVSETLGVICGFPAYLLLKYELWITETISYMPFALFSWNMSVWVLVMVYGVIIVSLLILDKKRCKEI